MGQPGSGLIWPWQLCCGAPVALAAAWPLAADREIQDKPMTVAVLGVLLLVAEAVSRSVETTASKVHPVSRCFGCNSRSGSVGLNAGAGSW
jgi:hypothetical protein